MDHGGSSTKRCCRQLDKCSAVMAFAMCKIWWVLSAVDTRVLKLASHR